MCSHDAKTNIFSAGEGLRVCVEGWGGGGVRPADPYDLRSRVRINRHSKIKEMRISDTELIGELHQKWTFKKRI